MNALSGYFHLYLPNYQIIAAVFSPFPYLKSACNICQSTGSLLPLKKKITDAVQVHTSDKLLIATLTSALIGDLASIPWLRYQRQLEMFIQMQSKTRIQETDNRLLKKVIVAKNAHYFFVKRKYSYLWRLNCCPLIARMSITIFPRQKIVPSVAAQLTLLH